MMKALLCYNEKDFRMEEIEKPSISDDEMLIELLYCGLCGSDIVRIFNTKDKPSVYWHEVVGKVVETGSGVKKFRKGDIVVAAHHIPCGECHYCKHGNHTMCKMFKNTNIYPGGFCQYIRLSPEHIKNGRLKVILADYKPTTFDIHAVYPERKFVPQKVKRMIEFLASKLD